MKKTRMKMTKLNELNWQYFLEFDKCKFPFDDITCMDLKSFSVEFNNTQVDKKESKFVSSLGYKFYFEKDLKFCFDRIMTFEKIFYD